MQKTTLKKKLVKLNGNNGHEVTGFNGNGFKNKVYVNMKIESGVSARFKFMAKQNGLEYSQYLNELLNYDHYEDLFSNGEFKESLTNFMRYIERRSKNPNGHTTF